MGAIPKRFIYPLEQRITQLKTRMNDLHQIAFTHDEFLSLYAPEEDHKILREAARVALVASDGGYFYPEFKSDRFTRAFGSNRVCLAMRVSPVDGFAPLLPRNAVTLDTAPPYLLERLSNWVIARVEQNFQFSRCELLLSWLNRNCETPCQVRYLWPSIVTLASGAGNEKLAEFADRLRELKNPGTLPPMPPEVKAAFKPTADIIAASSLLPEPETRAVSPVSVEIRSVDARRNEGALGWLVGA